MSRAFFPGAVLFAALAGCSPEIKGLIDANAECEFPLDGALRTTGILDVGPSPALAHPYDAVLLVKGAGGGHLTEASVAFSADGEHLPGLPDVEDNERVDALDLTLGDDGLGAVPFTLVTLEEAKALQGYTDIGTDLALLIEVRVVVNGGTNLPFFVDLQVCQTCLVGVGAHVEGDALVCSDGSAPALTADAPCIEGQDDVYSTCG